MLLHALARLLGPFGGDRLEDEAMEDDGAFGASRDVVGGREGAL